MTNNLTPRPEVRGAIVGVDTHKHIHVAVAVDTCGIHLGDQSFVADSGGYQARAESKMPRSASAEARVTNSVSLGCSDSSANLR